MNKIKLNKLSLFVFAFSLLMFANTLSHDYAWDDSIVIVENTFVKKGISSIPKLFLKSNSDYKADKYGYRPITLTTFAIEQSIFGNNPKAHHFFNVLYFSILCLLLFKVLCKIFSSYTDFLPFIATLLFTAHPIHCEVVANIKSRDEILAFLFALLSLQKVLMFIDTTKVKYLLYTILLLLLSFLSKESGIVFVIFIPLLLAYKQKDKNFRKLVLPFSAMIGVFAFCWLMVKLYTNSSIGVNESKGAGIFYESGILGNSFFYSDLISEKIANAFLLLLQYFKNFVWPIHLVYFSGYNQLSPASLGDPEVIISMCMHAGLLLLAIVYRKQKPALLLSVLFYFISISIYLHLVKTLADTMADRFYFVPSIGFILTILFVIELFWIKNLSSLTIETVFYGKKNVVLKYTLVLITLLLSILTYQRNQVWKNTETLITHDMPYLQNCARANQYYADILQEKISSTFDAQKENEMIAHYKKSIEISNESYYAYLKLGTYYTKVNRFSEAEKVLNDMLTKFPKQADVYFALGELSYKSSKYKEAIRYLTTSKVLAPEVPITYVYLGLAQAKEKQMNNALNTLRLCEQKFGSSIVILETKSEIYFENGDLQTSTDILLQSIELGADRASVYKKIIGRYQILNKNDEASFYYNQARNKGIL